MCLPQVIKSFQNYRGVATTFYPTLVHIRIIVIYSPCNWKCFSVSIQSGVCWGVPGGEVSSIVKGVQIVHSCS